MIPIAKFISIPVKVLVAIIANKEIENETAKRKIFSIRSEFFFALIKIITSNNKITKKLKFVKKARQKIRKEENQLLRTILSG